MGFFDKLFGLKKQENIDYSEADDSSNMDVFGEEDPEIPKEKAENSKFEKLESVISELKSTDVFTVSVQKKWLCDLSRVVPEVRVGGGAECVDSLLSEKALEEAENMLNTLSRIAVKTDSVLAGVDLERLGEKIRKVKTEKLISAYLPLREYYAAVRDDHRRNIYNVLQLIQGEIYTRDLDNLSFADSDEESREYAARLRRVFLRYMPKKNNMEMYFTMFEMINGTVDIKEIIDEAPVVFDKYVKNEALLKDEYKQVIAKSSLIVDKHLGIYSQEQIFNCVDTADNVTLAKTWIVLDLYTTYIKPEYTVNLVNLYDLITSTFIRRGVGIKKDEEEAVNVTEKGNAAPSENAAQSASDDTVEAAPQAEETDMDSYESVLGALRSALKAEEGEKAEALKARLAVLLLSRDEIYILRDSGFKGMFPYFGIDGKIQVYADKSRAEKLCKYLSEKCGVNVTVSSVAKENIAREFIFAWHMGADVMKLENGYINAEVGIGDVTDISVGDIVQASGRELRKALIAELQLASCIEAMPEDKKSGDIFDSFTKALAERKDASGREMANGLIYALVSEKKQDGKMLYTPAALELAKKLISDAEADESLLVGADYSGYEVCEGTLSMRVVMKKGQTREQAMVCAFTDIRNATRIREKFSGEGESGDSIVAVTFEDLKAQANACGGIVVDINTINYEVPKESFAK